MDEKRKVPKLRFPEFTDPWEQRKVGEYYDFKNGLNKGKEFFGKGTPIVNFTDVFHNRGIFPEMLKGKVRLEPSEIKNYEVKKGDLFFTRTSETIEEIGYPSVMLESPENTVFSGFVLRGRCFKKEDPLDNLFKKYVFFTDAFRGEMLRKSSMTTRALTSGTAIKNMEFLYPASKEEQYKIGKLLTDIDNLITLHQRKLDEIKTYKKGMLQKMFPQKGEVVPEIRFPDFTDPWEQRKLSDVGNIITGSTPKTNDTSNYGGEYLFVSPADIQGNRFIDSTITTLTKKGFDLGRKIRPKASLFVSIGSTIGKVAQTCIESTTNQQINAVEPFATYDDNFIFTLLETVSDSIKSIASNQAVPIVNKTTFGETEVLLPIDKDEQASIGEIFMQLDNLITLHQRKLEAIKEYKKGLLQQMFV